MRVSRRASSDSKSRPGNAASCPRNLSFMSAQTDVRYDALSDRTVIVATGRGARPHQFRTPDGDADPGTEHCPFCPGHEAMTPPEVARTGEGAPDTPGWRVRVTPNLYPIVDTHEVVVLTPDHYRSFGTLDDDAAIEVLTMLRDRVAAHLGRGQAVAVAILNHKREAGASLPHPHAQVLATDFVPPTIAAAVGRAAHAPTDLVLDDLARSEALKLTRGAWSDDTRAWCPDASSSPFLMRVANMNAGAYFDRAPRDEINRVALTTRDALAQLARTLDDPPYNIVIHSAPHAANAFHWYVEITPRLAVRAGFEQATGLFVNAVDPTEAARTLNGAHAVITIRVCTTIAAPPDQVWAAVEHVDRHIEWMQDAESITFRSDAARGCRRGVRLPDARRPAPHHRPLRGDGVGARCRDGDRAPRCRHRRRRVPAVPVG